MGSETFSGGEKRLHARASASGEVTFNAYSPSDNYGKSLYEKASGHAELIDISSGGARIRTFFPLDNRHILEINGDSPKLIASVVWVKKTDDCYEGGLMYVLDRL